MFGIAAALALLPAALLPADEHDFVLDTGRLVEVRRSDGRQTYIATGWLDAAGNFVSQKGGWAKGGFNFSGPSATTLDFEDFRGGVYEYRSAALVQGRLDHRFNFVPQVGSTVIDFRDYLKDHQPGVSRRIWNLPGYLYKKGTPPPLTTEQALVKQAEEEARKVMALLGMKGPVPPYTPIPSPYFTPPFPLENRPSAGGPAAAGARPSAPAPAVPIPPGTYEYVQDTVRWVELRRRYGDAEYWSLGRLDTAGNFVAEKDFLHKTGPQPVGTPNAAPLNRDATGPVYEYRSGALIRGKIDDRLNFVPELGSTVIDFKDYKYGPDALPIWNLPGSFKKK